MIVGDKLTFAIQSGITRAYARLSFRALGFFVIHIGGHRYGVHEPDATVLACSFSEVQRRIAHRGNHIAPFAAEADAGKIVDAFSNAIYHPAPENCQFHGLPNSALSDLVHTNHLMWAPDGDKAFDDGSWVLQFDVENRVRLIGNKRRNYSHDPRTLADIWLEAGKFYGTLEQWRDAFEAEWKAASKVPEH